MAKDVKLELSRYFSLDTKLSDFERGVNVTNDDVTEDYCNNATRYAQLKPTVELNHLIRTFSADASVVFVALPEPQAKPCHAALDGLRSSNYLASLDALTHELDSVILVRGAREAVTQFI